MQYKFILYRGSRWAGDLRGWLQASASFTDSNQIITAYIFSIEKDILIWARVSLAGGEYWLTIKGGKGGWWLVIIGRRSGLSKVDVNLRLCPKSRVSIPVGISVTWVESADIQGEVAIKTSVYVRGAYRSSLWFWLCEFLFEYSLVYSLVYFLYTRNQT